MPPVLPYDARNYCTVVLSQRSPSERRILIDGLSVVCQEKLTCHINN